MRKNYSTGARWESVVGYSRAVKIGNIIEVSGTVSVKDGEAYAMGDPYRQTQRILEIVGDALEHLGASHEDVIRTRTFVTDIKDWARVAKAHEEVYGKVRPATSLLEVSALITPAYMVEIEVSAVVS
jgi:enamine deaminase RidA (YjgF/YER057c/UK114 family)